MSAPGSSNNSDHQNPPFPGDNEDTMESLASDLARLQANVENVGLESIRNIFANDPDAAGEAIMGDGDGAPAMMFKMTTPKAKSASLPPTPSIRAPPTLTYEPWYPQRFAATPEGTKCQEYLTYVLRALKSETEALRQLSYAEQLVPFIGCPKSMELWVVLGPLLTQISNLGLWDVACDIAGYLYQEPDFVAPYLKCLNRLKPFLTRSSDKFFNLEERSSQIVNMFDATIASAQNHQEETIKFASQVSNVSSNLAGLQEVLERTMLKVKKLDLLPDLGSHIPSAITVPSLSSRPHGSRVVVIDMSIPGEYTGLYTMSINDNKIQLVLPPKNNPEIASIVLLTTQAQEVFINLDQSEILNRLSKQPELRKALGGPPLKERAPYFYKLVQGVQKRTNQWIKTDYGAHLPSE